MVKDTVLVNLKVGRSVVLDLNTISCPASANLTVRKHGDK